MQCFNGMRNGTIRIMILKGNLPHLTNIVFLETTLNWTEQPYRGIKRWVNQWISFTFDWSSISTIKSSDEYSLFLLYFYKWIWIWYPYKQETRVRKKTVNISYLKTIFLTLLSSLCMEGDIWIEKKKKIKPLNKTQFAYSFQSLFRLSFSNYYSRASHFETTNLVSIDLSWTIKCNDLAFYYWKLKSFFLYINISNETILRLGCVLET